MLASSTRLRFLHQYVANKEELLDAMIDVVFDEIELPAGEGDWKAAMRQRGSRGTIRLAPVLAGKEHVAGYHGPAGQGPHWGQRGSETCGCQQRALVTRNRVLASSTVAATGATLARRRILW